MLEDVMRRRRGEPFHFCSESEHLLLLLLLLLLGPAAAAAAAAARTRGCCCCCWWRRRLRDRLQGAPRHTNVECVYRSLSSQNEMRKKHEKNEENETSIQINILLYFLHFLIKKTA